jgi:O-antigen ligase
MLGWFFPAWTLALALRHAPDRQRLGRTLFFFLVTNGILLALSGLIQWAHYSGVLTRSFYATFGYRNHASAFFVLALAGVLGLLRYQIGWRHRAAESVWAPIVPGLGLAALLLTAALHTALCRAGMMFSWVLVLLFLGSLVFGKDSAQGLIRRIQEGAAAAMILGIAIAWVIIPEGTALNRIERMDSSGWMGQVEGRCWQWKAALRIWKDHKIWGTGGWGFAHLLPQYADEAYVQDGQLESLGMANVHNDFLQFLAEFGLAGVSLLLGAWGVLAARFIRGWRAVRGRPVSAIYLFSTAGLLLVGLHSLIDLPFRNPAILYAWIVLLAAVPAGWGVVSMARGVDGREKSALQEWFNTPISRAVHSTRRRLGGKDGRGSKGWKSS